VRSYVLGPQTARQDAVLIAMNLDRFGPALSVEDLESQFHLFAKLWGVLGDSANYSDLVMKMLIGLRQPYVRPAQ